MNDDDDDCWLMPKQYIVNRNNYDAASYNGGN